MRSLILYISICLGCIACKKINPGDIKDLPSCLVQEIKDAEKGNRTPIRSISLIKDGDTRYYYLLSECCDIFNEILDEDCNYVCAPDGGFTGQGDGKCPDDIDFSELINAGEIIWEKSE